MASTPESFKTYGFSYEEQLARAHWYKEDLEKGDWEVLRKDENSTYWVKSFPDKEIPLKVLYEYKMPLSAEQFSEVFAPARNLKDRAKWDKTSDQQVLETFPDNGGHVVTSTIELSWPLSDREFVLFSPPPKEIEWYGKRAIYNGFLNASHPSRPPNVCGRVRVKNGGNIYIAIPDEKDPENSCTLFGLVNNNYAGWMPRSVMSRLVARRFPETYTRLLEGFVDGYKNYIAKK